jgi:hypothetical protein
MKNDNFVTRSVDLHLFFMRIMKEHMFFIEVAFTPQNFNMQETATKLKERASDFLSRVVLIANNNVSVTAVESGEIVTKHTLNAENATLYYTNSPIDTNITKREYELIPAMGNTLNFNANDIVSLNSEAYQIVSDIIAFKTTLLNAVLNCSMFTMNYPLLIDHILREAKYYLKKITELQNNNQFITPQDMVEDEIFWNKIMAEHSKFIRGLLDPTEEELFNTSNVFAHSFDNLTKEVEIANNNIYQLTGIKQKNLIEVEKIRDFKEQGTIGLLNCKIKSIILPLLADHTLREANHFLKLLKSNSKI